MAASTREARPPSRGRLYVGVWRSPVARVVRVDEAPGSNPGTPTNSQLGPADWLGHFLTAGYAVRAGYVVTALCYSRLALKKIVHR